MPQLFADTPRHPLHRSRWLAGLRRSAFYSGLLLTGIAIAWVLGRYLVVPILCLLHPALDTLFYDWAVYGLTPQRSYTTYNLTSPASRVVEWDTSCDDGSLILLGLVGPAVSDPGPLIVDAKGELVWRSEQFAHASNLKVQRFNDQDFLTFWSGEKLEESGQGDYYMLDSSYNVAHTVSAAGDGMYGDLHEFKVTENGTALITVYDRMTANLDTTDMDWIEHGYIVNGIFQEIDIATGALLFEWRGADHFDECAYLDTSFGGYVKGEEAFDYFHINSVDKDAYGNYLVSLRHQWMLVYVSGTTGEILWALGGSSEDFTDLSDGAATDFRWQHDARWLDREEGLISLFNNGIARNHYSDAPHSSGRIIRVNIENRTVALEQEYVSHPPISSASQGSVQLLPDAASDDRIFIGWGSSAAFSHFSLPGTLLCEVHFAPALSFYLERFKSYRAIKAPRWDAVPGTWDPAAEIKGDTVFVSWNGATTVRQWVLQTVAQIPGAKEGEMEFEDVEVVGKEEFETAFALPPPEAGFEVGKRYAYRVAAVDGEGTVLRYSNTLTVRRKSQWPKVWWGMGIVALVGAVYGGWRCRDLVLRAWAQRWRRRGGRWVRYERLGT